uniref:SR-related CTD associated factor 1 n=1 Tax=Leptobrachium leishanense TaxID=445787 RepID=A0A8C5QID4_9ANUR
MLEDCWLSRSWIISHFLVMAEEQQDCKPTEQGADQEPKENPNGTPPDVFISGDHPEERRSGDPHETRGHGEGSCQPEALCPGQMIILKALQQVVGGTLQNEGKADHFGITGLKQKCSKVKKSCKKRPLRKSSDLGESKTLSLENEAPVPDVAENLLRGLASALTYLEKAYYTAASESPLISGAVEMLDFGDLYEESPEEVELVAEVQIGDIDSYTNGYSGLFRRNRHWRFQKSACLSSSRLQLRRRQSGVSLTTSPAERAVFPAILNQCSTRTLHRPRLRESCHAVHNPRAPRLRTSDRTSLLEYPHTYPPPATVLPGLPSFGVDPSYGLSKSRVQDTICPGRTTLPRGSAQTIVRNIPDSLVTCGLALGNGTGVSSGQQRPLGGESSTSNNQHSQPPSSLDKADSCSSSSSSSSHFPAPSSGGNGAQSSRSQDLDIYDPFHPTDEENVNGDYLYSDSPDKETEDQEDQKYDPFDPTGSNPSSSERSPSPYEDDDDDEDDAGSESPHEGRISEALAGIYDDNSLSQEFLGTEKGKENVQSVDADQCQATEDQESKPETDCNKPEPRRSIELSDSAGNENLAFEPYSPSSSIDLDRVDVEDLSKEEPEEKNETETPAADSTLDEPTTPEVSIEPRRRVFTVDVGKDYVRKTEFDSSNDSKSKLEIKVSLESIAKPDMKSYLRLEKIAKLGGESRSRHKQKQSSDKRDRGEDSDVKYDSEIEEGEIVQPDDDCFSPLPLFRSRCRVMDRPLRMVEGDDFLSLHADSDEEGALQIDFGENQADNRWKGLDLRRKITNQRRERYRKKSESPVKSKKRSKSRSPSSTRSRKKGKREHKRSRERKKSKEPRTSTATSWSNTKKSKDPKDRKRSRSRSHNKVSRSHSRDRRRSRSWTPSISTSISAVDSSRNSAERRKSRRSKSKEKKRHWSRSVSAERLRKDKHKEKHKTEGKKKKKRSRSRSRERDRRSSHRSNDRRDKDKLRTRHPLDEPKHENPPPLLDRRRRDSRPVVPPSIQDLNNADLFTIKRTITVNPEEKLKDREDLISTREVPGKREVLYDSEGLSFDTYSDRETVDDRDGKCSRVFDRHSGKSESGKRRVPVEFDKKRAEEERDSRQRASKDRDRKRSYDDSRERYKKRFKDVPEPEPANVKLEKEKIRPEKDKTSKKLKVSHKEGKGSSSRKVKLQSKVAVLIREGVSSTTSVKEAGSIGVKFSRDRESRSPFLKSDEKMPDIRTIRPKLQISDTKEAVVKPKKLKGLKTKTGVKKVKPVGSAGTLLKPKGTLEKKKKKLKVKASLKKSKADSCSKELPSPIQAKDEPIWSDTEKSETNVKPPSPPKPAIEQELTPDSQTVDSSCKTPDVSFIPEEPPLEPEQSMDLELDSMSEPKEESSPPPLPPPPPPSMSWNIQSGVDCTTSGVLALTALLFKMEEANMASRAKAQELIQATNQILSHNKPSTSLVSQPPPVMSSIGHSAPPYLLHSSLPLSGNSSPSTPTGISSLNTQTLAGSTTSSFFNTSVIDQGKRDGSTSSEGRGETDKYLKKLHTQERAVEEVKLAIKPYYQRKEITKEDYKDILRKAVHKICHSKSGEINPVKVNNLIKAYVQRYKYFRKHGKKMEDDESSSGYRGTKDSGGMDRALPPLPLI